MRRLLLILMAISLSLVTTSYACSMSGEAVHALRCCDGPSNSAPEGSPDCPADIMRLGEQSDGCCSIVMASSTSAQGQAESPIALYPPAFGRAMGTSIASPPPTLGVTPQRLARKAGSPPLYLLIGHFLR